MPLTSRLLLGLLLMQAIANFIPRTAAAASQRNDSAAVADNYLGFDRNIYPGDAALPVLRKDFSFAGFWISPPPGETSNTWIGKRALLRDNCRRQRRCRCVATQ